jgi:beta-lactamase superfamily II metal-dependent hydrolase
MGKAVKQQNQLRIRMYRVGFGDFFLLSVPADDGPKHILIDCGTTSGTTGQGDIGTIKDAVKQMADETQGKLALIIATHRHKDHIIGFSRAGDVFQQFKGNVDAVWMSAWETEYDPNEKKGKSNRLAFDFQRELTRVALGLQQHLALGGSGSADTDEIGAILENATGVHHNALAAAGRNGAGKGGGSNQASLEFLKNGLGIKPEYYARGAVPKLPASLVRAGLSAAILGPPPTDRIDFAKLMDLKKGLGQYLGDPNDGLRRKDDKRFEPFDRKYRVASKAYPKDAFREWRRESKKSPAAAMERMIEASQPALLLTAARTLDAFLNNQSLVVLFTYKDRKRLLFAGDAQGGNWEYWMFGGTPTQAPSVDRLVKDSKDILGHLDFYKMGHHGSTNATPISAVDAMGSGFTTMCSTQMGTFGSEQNESEVPRIPLLQALGKKSLIIRSDQIPVNVNGKPVPTVKGPIPKPAQGRVETGPLYVDYFP